MYPSKFSQSVFTTWGGSGALSCLAWIPLNRLWCGLDTLCFGPSYCRWLVVAYPSPSTMTSCWFYHEVCTQSWCSLYLPLGQKLLIPSCSVVWSCLLKLLPFLFFSGHTHTKCPSFPHPCQAILFFLFLPWVCAIFAFPCLQTLVFMSVSPGSRNKCI